VTGFERLSADADAIVVEAIAEAHRARHGFLGTEHLLIAFTSQPTVLPPAAAERLPPSDTVRDELARLVDTPVDAASDAALLATLGIDLAEVRRRAEVTFGPAALDRVTVRTRRHSRRGRRCFPMLTGDGLGVMPRVKQALERACVRSGDRNAVSPSALLLSVLDDEEAMATRVLAGLGVDVAALQVALRTTTS
jgi:ATP-dependent Clp protease ATP-binding subunit ClpA